MPPKADPKKKSTTEKKGKGEGKKDKDQKRKIPLKCRTYDFGEILFLYTGYLHSNKYYAALIEFRRPLASGSVMAQRRLPPTVCCPARGAAVRCCLPGPGCWPC